MQVVVYGLVGAVGGFVALQFLFKTRRSDG